MSHSNSDLVVVCRVQGEPAANIIKAHLESESIPAHIRGESLGTLYGLSTVGLGQISILVPMEFYEEAKHIIEPQSIDQNDNESKSKSLGIKLITSAVLIGLLIIYLLLH